MRPLVVFAAVLLAACDGGPDESYCTPCIGEVPAECEDICSREVEE